MASIGQTVEIRGQTAAGLRWLPAAILAVGEDGTLVIQDALHRVYHVHPSRIRREVRLHPKRARAARLRYQSMRDVGMTRTRYGWE